MPSLVAKRLDHVVGCDPHMRGPIVEHRDQRAQHPADGADLTVLRVPVSAPGRVEVAEQLVGAVDQMDLHRRTLPHSARSQRLGRESG